MKKCLIPILLLAASTTYGQIRYHVTDLQGLGGTYALAQGLNDFGQVVGRAYLPNSSYEHGFLWSNGVMQDLGTLGGIQSFATCINDFGQVGGSSYTSYGDGDYVEHAFIYQNGLMQDLGTVPGGLESSVNAINESGSAAGDAQYQACLFSNGQIQLLGVLPGGTDSGAYAFNESGQAVGYSDTDGFSGSHATLFSGGTIQDLGTLPGYANSVAIGINASGQIVGNCTVPGAQNEFRAFIFSSGSMQDLGTLGGNYTEIFAINDLGQIVGSSQTIQGLYHPFIYYAGGMTDISTLLDVSSAGCQFEITGITNSGLMCGTGTTPTSQGLQDALLITPIAPNAIVPSSYSMYRGFQTGGSLYSIQFNDSWYLTAQLGPTLNPSEAPIQVQLSGTSPTATPAELQFTFTGHVNTVGLSESILLYNFTTNAYENLGSSSAHNGSDSTVTVTASGSLSRFVNPSTLEVRARVTFSQSGPTAIYPWTASLGVANWIIQ